ncbi:MAG: hypothetical protein JW936_08415 [Sedimentisphaerales bacterium]|nr:hypothetical protein [Sedimentisphaerales bacterium]
MSYQGNFAFGEGEVSPGKVQAIMEDMPRMGAGRKVLLYIKLTLAMILTTAVVGFGQLADVEGLADGPGDSNALAGAEEQVQTLLPEGTLIVNRQARLVHDLAHNRWFLCFLPAEQNGDDSVADGGEATVAEVDLDDPYSVPMEVLPGRWLTNMINFCGNQEDVRVTFRVWGEVTTYQNRNYILPTMVAALSIFGEQGMTSRLPNQNAGAQVNEEDADGDEAGGELAEQLRELLVSIPRTAPLASRMELTEDLAEDREVGLTRQELSSEELLLDGEAIIDRVGHLVYDPDEHQWMFLFEADASSLAEAPIGVLPCQLLEMMERMMDNTGTRTLRFRVSGQVTQYNRQNFILLRKALVVYGTGNLGG